VTTELEHAPQSQNGAVPSRAQPPAEERPRWPVWFGPAAFFAGLFATLIAFALAGAVAAAIGHNLPNDSPGVELGGTLAQDAFFVIAAVVFASFVAPPRPWQFGLRSAPLKPTLRQAGLALGAFYIFALAYIGIFSPHGQQSVAKDLGANHGGLDMVLGGILVIALAPAAEEFFFRGFFYRALRSRFAMVTAAIIDGLVFGAIHYTDPKTLSLLPILAVLGFIFCLLYERTGTLLAPIALHSINNAIAYASAVHSAGALSAALAVVVVTICVTLLRTLGAPVPRAAAPG
jgi:membrane protease YdiL (CAAX protease family)